jgi:hypothetical protein
MKVEMHFSRHIKISDGAASVAFTRRLFHVRALSRDFPEGKCFRSEVADYPPLLQFRPPTTPEATGTIDFGSKTLALWEIPVINKYKILSRAIRAEEMIAKL